MEQLAAEDGANFEARMAEMIVPDVNTETPFLEIFEQYEDDGEIGDWQRGAAAVPGDLWQVATGGPCEPLVPAGNTPAHIAAFEAKRRAWDGTVPALDEPFMAPVVTGNVRVAGEDKSLAVRNAPSTVYNGVTEEEVKKLGKLDDTLTPAQMLQKILATTPVDPGEDEVRPDAAIVIAAERAVGADAAPAAGAVTLVSSPAPAAAEAAGGAGEALVITAEAAAEAAAAAEVAAALESAEAEQAAEAARVTSILDAAMVEAQRDGVAAQNERAHGYVVGERQNVRGSRIYTTLSLTLLPVLRRRLLQMCFGVTERHVDDILSSFPSKRLLMQYVGRFPSRDHLAEHLKTCFHVPPWHAGVFAARLIRMKRGDLESGIIERTASVLQWRHEAQLMPLATPEFVSAVVVKHASYADRATGGATGGGPAEVFRRRQIEEKEWLQVDKAETEALVAERNAAYHRLTQARNDVRAWHCVCICVLSSTARRSRPFC